MGQSWKTCDFHEETNIEKGINYHRCGKILGFFWEYDLQMVGRPYIFQFAGGYLPWGYHGDIHFMGYNWN